MEWPQSQGENLALLKATGVLSLTLIGSGILPETELPLVQMFRLKWEIQILNPLCLVMTNKM